MSIDNNALNSLTVFGDCKVSHHVFNEVIGLKKKIYIKLSLSDAAINRINSWITENASGPHLVDNGEYLDSFEDMVKTTNVLVKHVTDMLSDQTELIALKISVLSTRTSASRLFETINCVTSDAVLSSTFISVSNKINSINLRMVNIRTDVKISITMDSIIAMCLDILESITMALIPAVKESLLD